MRKLLNTLYVTRPYAYLSVDGNNIVCKDKDDELLRLPFDFFESIVCFSYCGCSPAFMGRCIELGIPISFHAPSGKFLARMVANTRGNVAVRIRQVERFRSDGLHLAKRTVSAKLRNSGELIRRSARSYPDLKQDEDIRSALDALERGHEAVESACGVEQLMGIEGNCAAAYFGILGRLFRVDIDFEGRNRRPPRDPANAALSFTYAILTNEFTSALESVGVDPQIGYYHSPYSGRDSLSCDMMEEVRCIADRFVLTLFDRRELTDADFEEKDGGILLNAKGRKKLIGAWQEKKKQPMHHDVIDEKIPMGLLPYVQCKLLAAYLRDERQDYPNFQYRG